MLLRPMTLAVGAAIVAAGLYLSAGPAAAASSLHDCLRDVAARELAAKTDFQRSMRDMIVDGRPEFEALADINMRLQIALAEETLQQIEFLLEIEPTRIDAEHGLSPFTNFDWSPTDTMRLRDQSGAYYDLDRKISALKTANNDHPDWPALRDYFQGELSGSPVFTDLMADFQARLHALEADLGACQKAK